jgi:CRISPR/Cas system-associated protein Cas5 (RAMP superfamily)
MAKKKIEKTNWKPTDDRFVAFLDILGFKDLVMRKSHEEIYQSLNQISKSKKLIEKAALEIDSVGDAEVYVVSFSDSIVIFSKNDSIENFRYFLLATRWLFTGAFNKQIPIKGAMAHGEISLNKTEQIYFGQPIIDAYLMEEDVNYMGVVAHNSIDEYIANIKNQEEKDKFENILIEEKTPLKCGLLTHTNLNWFRIIKPKDKDNFDIQDIKDKINLFKKSASGTARKYIDNSISFLEKIENRV